MATAQDTKNALEVNPEEVTDLMCNCINSFMDKLHPQTQIMMKDIATIGEEEAKKKLMKYLEDNPDDLDRIMKDGAALENFEYMVEQEEGCENISKIIAEADKAEGSDTRARLEARLESNSACAFTNIFYKMGKQ